VTTIEIKLLWLALWPAIQILLELRDRPFTEYLKRLHAAAAALGRACQERGSDQSPQAKFGEAKASSWRALGENHNPVLDRFPELVEVSRRACSHDLATYMTDEVRLPADQFLDMAHVLAHDGAKAAAVANPPARIRLALARNERRRKRLYRQRWKQPTPEQTDGLRDPHNVELSANAMLDWERVRQGLPPDQTRAVEARIDGVNLQALDAADHLGWDAARLNAIRRSLEPDRRWGQILRKRLSSYNSKRDSSQ
jgi:hypothetical protein